MTETTPKTSTKAPATVAETIDQDALSAKDLAKAVLAREIRPRVGSIRRLAEAVLQSGSNPKKNKKKKAASGGKASNKKRKLAKIPGQKKDQQKGK